MVNEHFLKLCELRAQLAMTSALTGHVLQRDLQHYGGEPFTNEEKIAHAIETAQQHINLYQEHVDNHGYED